MVWNMHSAVLYIRDDESGLFQIHSEWNIETTEDGKSFQSDKNIRLKTLHSILDDIDGLLTSGIILRGRDFSSDFTDGNTEIINNKDVFSIHNQRKTSIETA